MDLKIVIASQAGCGKTTVSKIVEEALRNAGFNVTNSDPDKDHQINFERAKRTLAEKIEIKIENIHIETLQLSRYR